MRLLAVILLALALATAAAAKGPLFASVCGSSGCKPVADAHVVYDAVLSPPVRLVDAPRPARYYRVTFTSGPDGPRGSLLYVPERRLLFTRAVVMSFSSGPYWRTMSPRAERVLRRLTTGMAPYAAPPRWPRPR